MKRPLLLAGGCAVTLVLLALAGCSTLTVTTPNGTFLSTGDHVPGVKTPGVIQGIAITKD